MRTILAAIAATALIAGSAAACPYSKTMTTAQIKKPLVTTDTQGPISTPVAPVAKPKA